MENEEREKNDWGWVSPPHPPSQVQAGLFNVVGKAESGKGKMENNIGRSDPVDPCF